MQPRREPLLWLQCLAIGAIPLELLLIRVLLAGADPGPVPLLERLLLWAVAVLAPAVALWRRPADWGSLLLLRIPTEIRTEQQKQLSDRQWGLINKVFLIVIAVGLLPLIWWLDESAGLVQELSPVQDRSRLVTLLLSTPLLALVVWQVQQLVQAILLLSGAELNDEPTEPWDSQRLKNDRSSFGLQLLRIPPLSWSESGSSQEAADTSEPEQPQPPKTEIVSPENTSIEKEENCDKDHAERTADEVQPDVMEDEVLAEEVTGENVQQVKDAALEEPESILTATAVPVEPEQGGENQESTRLDAEVVEGDAVAGGEAEQHGEHPEASGGEERDPDEAPESTPGGL